MMQVQTESTACHWFIFLDDRTAGRDSPINSSIDRSIIIFFYQSIAADVHVF